MKLVSKLAVIAAMALFSGCAHITQEIFSLQTGCPESQTHMRTMDNGTHEVTGCGQAISYRCDTSYFPSKRTLCAAVLEPSYEDDYLPPNPATPPPLAPTVSSRRDGSQVIRVKFRVSDRVSMLVAGRPAVHPDSVVMYLQLLGRSERQEECDVRMAIDGQAIALPAARQEELKGARAVRITLSINQIRAIAEADRVAGRVCGRRWELTERELSALRAFVIRFREELALDGDPQENAPASPSGGTI